MKGKRLAGAERFASMRDMRRTWIIAGLLATSAMAEEKGWIPLFDGKSLKGWKSPAGTAPGKGWKIEDGCLHRAEAGGDLLSEKEFTDFELEFEWKIAAAGNSGVKYRVRKSPAGWLGPEYQVLDDAGHPNGKVADTTSASLYEVVPAAKEKTLKPPGEWNTSKIVARGTVIEHWLNGKLAMKTDTAGPEWPAMKKASKFARVEGFAEPAAGRILLQDHGDPVWFRAIRLREL
jgi:hypothetical protein